MPALYSNTSVFDNGKLKHDRKGARAEMDQLLEAMRHPETYDREVESGSALVNTHNAVLFRVLEVSKPTLKKSVES